MVTGLIIECCHRQRLANPMKYEKSNYLRSRHHDNGSNYGSPGKTKLAYLIDGLARSEQILNPKLTDLLFTVKTKDYHYIINYNYSKN